MKLSRTSSLRNGFAVIAGGAAFSPRLEGCPRVRVLHPSFETLAEFSIGPRSARTRWQAPQDEVHHLRHPEEAPPGPRNARPDDRLRAVSKDAPQHDARDTPSPSRRAFRASFANNVPPSAFRGRRRPSREGAGKTGCALHPRSRVQGVERDAHEHTGSAEAVRPSLRNGFNGFLRALPGDRLSCHRRL